MRKITRRSFLAAAAVCGAVHAPTNRTFCFAPGIKSVFMQILHTGTAAASRILIPIPQALCAKKPRAFYCHESL